MTTVTRTMILSKAKSQMNRLSVQRYKVHHFPFTCEAFQEFGVNSRFLQVDRALARACRPHLATRGTTPTTLQAEFTRDIEKYLTPVFLFESLH